VHFLSSQALATTQEVNEPHSSGRWMQTLMRHPEA
jgi:hypothetical protein